jgi:hypothetical protein
MASKRNLKKNVNAVCFDIIDELMTMQDMYNPKKEEIRQLLDEAIIFRNDFINRINTAKKEEKPGKALKTLNEELEEQTISFLDRLNALAA